MAKRKTKPEPEDHWAEYFAMQLTEEESAALRAESQKEIDRMRREGVYEKLIALRGKVHLNLDLDEIRKLRKDRR
jgi:hypothetical protein